MFPMPNLGGIGDIILIQNLKTGNYYIDCMLIILFLFLLHHGDIFVYITRGINFMYSMNKETTKQMVVNMKKGDMHRIFYQGNQYIVGYNSMHVNITYPDPIIYILDYYTDIIEEKRKRQEKNGLIINLRYIEVIDKNNNMAKVYIPRTNLPIEIETLTKTDRYNEYVMTGLRTIWGVSLNKIEQEFGETYLHYLNQQAAKFIEDHLLFVDDNILRTTKKGKFLSDGIASDLFLLNLE